MVLVLSLSTVACGKDGESGGAKDKADEKKVVTVKDGEPSKEILEASKFDPEIQIGNAVLQIPFTFQDVLDAGATMQGNDYTPEYMMMADDKVSVKISIGDGQMKLWFQNSSDTVCSLKDATVISSMGYGIESDSSSVIILQQRRL